MRKLQCLEWNIGTNPAGLTPHARLILLAAREQECQCGAAGPAGAPRLQGLVAELEQVLQPRGRPLQAILAKRAGFVLESTVEAFEMSRTYAFWFYFYFPQPLAEGLS